MCLEAILSTLLCRVRAQGGQGDQHRRGDGRDAGRRAGAHGARNPLALPQLSPCRWSPSSPRARCRAAGPPRSRSPRLPCTHPTAPPAQPPSARQFLDDAADAAAVEAKVFGAALARWQMGVADAPSNKGLKPQKFNFYDRDHYYQARGRGGEGFERRERTGEGGRVWRGRLATRLPRSSPPPPTDPCLPPRRRSPPCRPQIPKNPIGTVSWWGRCRCLQPRGMLRWRWCPLSALTASLHPAAHHPAAQPRPLQCTHLAHHHRSLSCSTAATTTPPGPGPMTPRTAPSAWACPRRWRTPSRPSSARLGISGRDGGSSSSSCDGGGAVVVGTQHAACPAPRRGMAR